MVAPPQVVKVGTVVKVVATGEIVSIDAIACTKPRFFSAKVAKPRHPGGRPIEQRIFLNRADFLVQSGFAASPTMGSPTTQTRSTVHGYPRKKISPRR